MIEASGGRPRPVGQPAFQQFGERGDSVLPRNKVISPLAANLIGLMEQAHQSVLRRGFSEFYPQWWMYDKILEVGSDYSPWWRNYWKSEQGKRFAQKEGLEPYINLRHGSKRA